MSSGFRRGIFTSWNSFWEDVRKVDKTGFDPSKAERMAEDTFSRLLRARNLMERSRKYGSFRKPISYDLIRADVGRWIRADEKNKAIIFGEIKARIDKWFRDQELQQQEQLIRKRTKVEVVVGDY